MLNSLLPAFCAACNKAEPFADRAEVHLLSAAGIDWRLTGVSVDFILLIIVPVLWISASALAESFGVGENIVEKTGWPTPSRSGLRARRAKAQPPSGVPATQTVLLLQRDSLQSQERSTGVQL